MSDVDHARPERDSEVEVSPRLGVHRALRIAHRMTWRDPLVYLLTLLAVQGLVVLIATPIIKLIYDSVLVETGLGSIAYDDLTTVLRNPLADLALLLVAVIVVVVVTVGFAVVFALSDQQQAAGSAAARPALARLAVTGRKLAHPQGLLLVPYLLLILPLGQFGLSSTLTGGIRVPPFVSEELSKTPSGMAAYAGVMLIIFYVSVRLLFVLPVLTTTDASVWRSFTTSWRLTRWRTLRMIWLVVLASLPAGVVLLFTAAAAAVPTLITDEVAPDWSPLMAATGLTVWQIGLFVVTSLVAVLVAQSLTALKRDWLPRLPDPVQPRAAAIPQRATAHRKLHVRALAAITAVIAFVLATAYNFITISAFDDSKVSEVLAHRGWVAGGVENTLPALHAAKQSGAHRVEFDVLQTKDNKFVVMHDTNLQRLAGIDRNVKDMTQAELMQVTVRANGMEATIPSLEQWIETSKELDLPQLLEVKIHGAESPDMIPRLLALLDSYDVTDWYIYHSLSRNVVEQLKAARPGLAVGYIVPINFGGIPKINSDFIVIEEGSYSQGFLQQARDEDFAILVWTPNTSERIRTYMRDGADGVITDSPHLGVTEEATISDEKGLAPRLLDRIERGFD